MPVRQLPRCARDEPIGTSHGSRPGNVWAENMICLKTAIYAQTMIMTFPMVSVFAVSMVRVLAMPMVRVLEPYHFLRLTIQCAATVDSTGWFIVYVAGNSIHQYS